MYVLHKSGHRIDYYPEKEETDWPLDEITVDPTDAKETLEYLRCNNALGIDVKQQPDTASSSASAAAPATNAPEN